MWALRRASIQLRNRGLSSASGTARILCAKSQIEKCCTENHNYGVVESHNELLQTPLYSAARSFSSSPGHSNLCYMDVHGFCSEAKSKDHLDDAIPEHESPHTIDDNDSMSESELSDVQIESETMNTESDVSGKKIPAKFIPIMAMTKAILASPTSPVNKVLDEWVKAGNEVTQTEIALTMFQLRKRRMFFKALQLSEWLESTGHFVPVESNHASRVDLLAKVRGIFKAEEYIKQIPESVRSEIVYCTLLANCVATKNVPKGEEIFNKMKKLFPLTTFSCNQLLLLYKKTDKKKIADHLILMKKENVKASVFTYQILIDFKGQIKDIAGMEKIVETMKSEGIEPNTNIQVTMSRHYAINKLIKKSEAILKEIEGCDLVNNRWACCVLLLGYAYIGKSLEVDRVWGLCEPNTRNKEYLSAIKAFGLLGRIEDAESAFKKLTEQYKRPSVKHYVAMIKVYADHKMLDKGKELHKKISEKGLNIGPLGNDALVRLYVAAGEVEKAESILEKARQERMGKPFRASYLVVLDEYANRGDVHGAERVFSRMKQQGGYAWSINSYKSLIFAYINAKKPVYGFAERMKRDNLVPNKAMSDLIARADPFKKSPVAELLE